MSYEIIEKLKKRIADYQDNVMLEDVGEITETSDGIVKISGLRQALSQELLTVRTATEELPVLAFNMEEDTIGGVVLAEASKVRVGDRVYKTGKVASLKVGRELLGRVIDPLGKPLDGKGSIFTDESQTETYLLERLAPSVVSREAVKIPVHTGIKAIDAMVPIGRGQRELIIGDRQTGKTAIAIDTIINQKNDVSSNRKQMLCIYVAIGQKNSKIAKIVDTLDKAGALAYTIVVSAPASSPVALQYLAPFAGAAIGEYFMDRGEDALVVYDDLSKHANAYRQISLLMRRPPGREAYPGDVFYLHSRLLERAAKMDEAHGGGSLTALPIIETQLGDVSAYIPTNVISITDGQIYLESDLFNQGVRPAVNAGLSVSRVGSAAQTKAMKKVASRLRLELAQFRELQAFVQFASDLDENTKKKIERGQLLVEVLKQMDLAPMPFEREVVILYAAINGFLDGIDLTMVKDFESGLLDFIDKKGGDEVFGVIKKTSDIDARAEESLKKLIEEYKQMIKK